MTVSPRFNEPPDWDAIARHRAGESEDDEARHISEWLAAHPEDAAMLMALDGALAGHAESSVSSADAPDVEAALRTVRGRMHEEMPARVIPIARARSANTPARPLRRWVAGTIAAAAAMAALAVGLGRTRDAREPAAVVVARGAPGSVVTTGVGVRDSVRLPDGTRVILAPASRLTVSPSYGHDAREVTVEGAAWIAVRHDDAKPFVVHAGPALVRDLGTTFAVRTDDGSSGEQVTVAVAEGVVELRPRASPAAGVTLSAGDRGELRADGGVRTVRGGAGDEELAWVHGRLVYRDAPLALVRTDLRRWYGVELRVADSSLLARRITATFDDEPVDHVLEVIAVALGATVERHDSVAIMRGGAAR